MQTTALHRFWRDYSDAASRRWLKPRLSRGRFALKTDMFDETWTEGLIPMLAAAYGNVVGLDISDAVLLGQRTGNCTLLTQADVRQLPFQDASFDCVLSPSTLDHFDSEEQIALSLGEIQRVLRPGGELLLTLDNSSNPVVRFRNALPAEVRSRIGLIAYPVGITCSPARLGEMLRAAGFLVKEMTAIVHCPRFAVILLARYMSSRMKRGLLSTAMWFERLQEAPTRFLTGYFSAVHAVKVGDRCAH